ncbi:MAG: CBS domain-containing protein, partial [Sulfurimonadaceae bacterium]
QAVKAVPHEEWHHLQVGGLMQPQSPDNSVAPDTPVKEALSKMSGIGLSRLLVLEHGKMVGIVTLKDLLEFLALKMELEA